MNSYKYTNGILESIELPELTPELTWGPVGSFAHHDGHDYKWHCGLPSEALSAGLGVFSITIYRAASDRAPYPLMAFVDFGDHPGEVYFPELRDLIQYAREHAQLLQVTVLAGIADQIDEAMRWLFDYKRGLFRDHVEDVYRRERRDSEVRRRKSPPVSAQTKS
jgi:hypothetical protein